MDLKTRKYKFIEQVLKIKSFEKIELLEQFITKLSTDDEVAGYTIKGEPLTVKEYKAMIKESEKSLDKGTYFTQQEIENKFLND